MKLLMAIAFMKEPPPKVNDHDVEACLTIFPYLSGKMTGILQLITHFLSSMFFQDDHLNDCNSCVIKGLALFPA